MWVASCTVTERTAAFAGLSRLSAAASSHTLVEPFFKGLKDLFNDITCYYFSLSTYSYVVVLLNKRIYINRI